MPNQTPNIALAIEAATWIGITEIGGDNRGPEVEAFQRAVNPKPNGESWCMDFAQFCVDRVATRLVGVERNLYRSESCLDVWNKTDVAQRLTTPEPGALVIWEHGTSGLGHCGIIFAVLSAKEICTVEGNTSPGFGEIINRNGDGVYPKKRNSDPAMSGPDFRLIGFLRPFKSA